jgi:phosphinothricin acetyltransferase
MEIRAVRPGDYQAICDIYNHYIENTVISFEEEALCVSDIEQRVLACTELFPWLVCIDQGGLVGYSYANRWQVRCAYRQCVETSVYLDPARLGRGYGAALYAELLPRLTALGLHTAIAGIALPNAASISLHERMGYKRVALFSEVGRKMDKWVDVGYWQKMLAAP